jgi:hypothetical protein
MKKVFVLIPIVISVFLMISCGSAPAAVTEPTPSGSTVDVSEARNRAAASREQALSIKAEVAVKPDFDNGETVFNSAETAADPVAAFLEAERLFTAAYDKAKVLRDAAMNELQKAQAEIKTAEDEAAAFEIERAAEEESL